MLLNLSLFAKVILQFLENDKDLGGFGRIKMGWIKI